MFAGLGDEVLYFAQMSFVVQQIGLVEDDDNLFAPGANVFQKESLALREGAINRGNEEDQIAAWHKISSQLLVSLQHGVHTRSINDTDVAQEIRRVMIFQQ